MNEDTHDAPGARGAVIGDGDVETVQEDGDPDRGLDLLLLAPVQGVP